MDLPDEILVDIFLPLDRLSLEALKLTRRRFQPLIDTKLSVVCVRGLTNVVLELRNYKTYVVEAVLEPIWLTDHRPPHWKVRKIPKTCLTK